MGQDYVDEASAGTAVGTDLMADHREQTRAFRRVLQKVALTGSAAAGDMVIEVFIGDSYAGRLDNTRTGTVVLDLADWKLFNVRIPPGEKLMFKVADAGATNIARVHFTTTRY